MELEADRPRLDVADTGEEQPGKQILVRESFFEFRYHHFEALVAWGVFNQSHNGLDLRAELDHIGMNPCLFGPKRGNCPQVGPWCQFGT